MPFRSHCLSSLHLPGGDCSGSHRKSKEQASAHGVGSIRCTSPSKQWSHSPKQQSKFYWLININGTKPLGKEQEKLNAREHTRHHKTQIWSGRGKIGALERKDLPSKTDSSCWLPGRIWVGLPSPWNSGSTLPGVEEKTLKQEVCPLRPTREISPRYREGLPSTRQSS